MPISRVHVTKFLGVHIDLQLNWKNHNEYNRRKLPKCIGILSKARRKLQKSSLISLYDSFALLYFIYCNHVGEVLIRQYLNNVVLVQKELIRIKHALHLEPTLNIYWQIDWWYNHNKMRHNQSLGLFYGIYSIWVRTSSINFYQDKCNLLGNWNTMIHLNDSTRTIPVVLQRVAPIVIRSVLETNVALAKYVLVLIWSSIHNKNIIVGYIYWECYHE